MGDRTQDREFTIVRVLDAPRELVFRAWTEPDHLTRWFGPRGFSTPRDTIAADVRPGGTWRATLVDDATGARHPTGGFYLAVVPPERLVFTWTEPGGSGESVVTVLLDDLGDGRTSLRFHHAGFTTDEGRAAVHDGWSSALDRLTEEFTP
jgi:uncharacterized protein YndB with AHSA1/START domain